MIFLLFSLFILPNHLYPPNSVEFVREAGGSKVEVVFGKLGLLSSCGMRWCWEVKVVDEKTCGERRWFVVGVAMGIVGTRGSRDGDW